jgi:hypothetical protein
MQAESQVLDAAHPLGAIDSAALCGGQDLTTRHIDDRHAHLGVKLGDDAGLATLHPFEVSQVLDRTLEPAERLRAGWNARKCHQIELQLLLIELVPQLKAAAFVDPADEVDWIHAEDTGRRIGEKRRRDVLAVPPV